MRIMWEKRHFHSANWSQWWFLMLAVSKGCQCMGTQQSGRPNVCVCQGHQGSQDCHWHEWQYKGILKASERITSLHSSILFASLSLCENRCVKCHSSVWYLLSLSSSLHLSSLHACRVWMQMLKQLAWEAWFQCRVTAARERELETLNILGYLTAFSMLSHMCVPFLVWVPYFINHWFYRYCFSLQHLK